MSKNNKSNIELSLFSPLSDIDHLFNGNLKIIPLKNEAEITISKKLNKKGDKK